MLLSSTSLETDSPLPGSRNYYETSFVISRLDYCNAVLARLPRTTIQPLQRVQNAAARSLQTPSVKIIYLQYFNSSTDCQSFFVFNINYVCWCTIFILHVQCPQYLHEAVSVISETQSRRDLRSTDNLQYVKHKMRTVFVERSFSILRPAACKQSTIVSSLY